MKKKEIMILSNGEGAVETDSDSLKDIIDDATTDEISRNLIYVSNDKNKVTKVMLEICNTKTNNMDYVTIPVKTNYTIFLCVPEVMTGESGDSPSYPCFGFKAVFRGRKRCLWIWCPHI